MFKNETPERSDGEHDIGRTSDVAHKAGVGLGTLYRHFPTREALLETLLRASFDALTARASELETAGSADDALVLWLRETIAVTPSHRGVITSTTNPRTRPIADRLFDVIASAILVNRGRFNDTKSSASGKG